MAKKPRESQNEMDERSEAEKMAAAGLAWLYELELVNSPTLLNNLYGNLYSFPKVQDCEIIIDKYQKKMLIWVKFTWFTRKFLKARRHALIMDMLDQLQTLLPSFEFRLTEDRALFERALKKTQEMLFGGKDAPKTEKPKEEKPAETIADPANDVSDTVPSQSGAATIPDGSPEPAAAENSSKTGETDSKKST